MEVQRSYKGKIMDCGLVEKEGKSPRVYVKFECVTDEGEVKNVTWWGTLKEGKATEIAIVTLLKVGFTSDWDALANGSDLTKIFTDLEKVWELVVVDEQWNGKTFEKVKYINDPDAPRGKMAPQQAATVVKSMNLKALTLQKQAEMGHILPTQPKKAVNSSTVTTEDIPF